LLLQSRAQENPPVIAVHTKLLPEKDAVDVVVVVDDVVAVVVEVVEIDEVVVVVLDVVWSGHEVVGQVFLRTLSQVK
jgi:hypothetical protein